MAEPQRCPSLKVLPLLFLINLLQVHSVGVEVRTGRSFQDLASDSSVKSHHRGKRWAPARGGVGGKTGDNRYH